MSPQTAFTNGVNLSAVGRSPRQSLTSPPSRWLRLRYRFWAILGQKREPAEASLPQSLAELAPGPLP